MKSMYDNLFFLQAMNATLQYLPDLLAEDWYFYRPRLVQQIKKLNYAHDPKDVHVLVDSMIDELLQSRAADFVEEILRESKIRSTPSIEDTLDFEKTPIPNPDFGEDGKVIRSRGYRGIYPKKKLPFEINLKIESLSGLDEEPTLNNFFTVCESLSTKMRYWDDDFVTSFGKETKEAGLEESTTGPEPPGPTWEAETPNIPPEERHISAWINRSAEDSQKPLERQKDYELDFKVGALVESSLLDGQETKIESSDIPEEGLETIWVVIPSAVDLFSLDNDKLVDFSSKDGSPQAARFSLLIPREGESLTVHLGIKLHVEGDPQLDVIIYALGQDKQHKDLYRQFKVKLPVENGSTSSEIAASLVQDDTLHAPASQLNLKTTHEWTTPPGKLNIIVTGQSTAYVFGDAGAFSLDEPTQWYGVQASVNGPITNVRASAEKFRGKWEKYLNDIDPQDLINRLQDFSAKYAQYDWANFNYFADPIHEQSWQAVSASKELFRLAFDGFSLYEAFFPVGSDLRTWLDALPPGQRLSISWQPTSGAGWLAHIPWGLMYRSAPVKDAPVDPTLFLGLRYRISYTAHVVQAPSRALGTVDESHVVALLYWGQQPQDPTGLEARWQENQLKVWPTQIFVPSTSNADAPKAQLVQMLNTPGPSPVTVLYFFCQSSGSGNDPILRFGDTAQDTDVLDRTEWGQTTLADRPIVFANACTTATSDPYIANELERAFFNRQCRAYLGTESKVPIPLASRFAFIFFNFLYRKVDPEPMAAGEAVAQTRLFLWTQYKNIGGLLYTYINQYELYMAKNSELMKLKL